MAAAVVAMLTTSPASSDEFTDCARGFAAIARGYDDIAIHYCSQVLRSPRFSEAQKSRALDFRAAAYRESNQDRTAFDALEATAARLPATFENLVVLALIQVRGGRLDAAAASFSAALSANANDPRVHYNRGLVFHLMARHREAIADYQHSLDLSPDDADTHYNLGLAHSNPMTWAPRSKAMAGRSRWCRVMHRPSTTAGMSMRESARPRLRAMTSCVPLNCRRKIR